MRRKKVSLCITSIGGTLMPATLKLLRQSKRFEYYLVGTNETDAPHVEGLLDAFYIVPKGDDPRYSKALLDIIRTERPEVILPWSDDEAEAISRLTKELYALGAIAMVSSQQCLARISNKRVTYDNLRQAGILVPEFTAVSNISEMRDAIADYGYPTRTVVIKPSRGRGGRGLQALVGFDDPPNWLGSGQREVRHKDTDLLESKLAKFFDFGKELLVMPCLGEPAFDADVIVFGKDPTVLVRRRHNPTGIPFLGNTLLSDPNLVDYCHQIAKVLELEALHDIDLMTGLDGQPVILEVNPRPSGSLVAGMTAGFPILDWAVERALGGDPATFGSKHDIDVLSV